MNDVLQLKGRFDQKKNTGGGGPTNLPAGSTVTAAHLLNLTSELQGIADFWRRDQTIEGVLISAYYTMVVAKSNRVSGIFKHANDRIVGAKFTNDPSPKHIITYHLDDDQLTKAIDQLKQCVEILNQHYDGKMTATNLQAINLNKSDIKDWPLKRSVFAQIIVDAYYVDHFNIDRSAEQIENAALVSLYDLDVDMATFLRSIGIDVLSMNFWSKTTFLATPEQFQALKAKVPYLIAMAVTDLADFSFPEGQDIEPSQPLKLPEPTNEPVVGVIDTVFKSNVYFSSWVEDHDLVSKDIPTTSSEHGTEVDSIIVDGPAFNPALDDGCGRFRVRHFGVSNGGVGSSFTIMKMIKEIVSSNRDIRVWNLCLGSQWEINPNFVSPEAALLDQLQYEYDIIFIIAGTNKNNRNTSAYKIGAPADSINSIVVNAVDEHGVPTTYTRTGPVLSFFIKPDIACFGGSQTTPMKVCSSVGENQVAGTSFAAPWITRKMAYLMEVMGFTRETAKALLIDSASGWKTSQQDAASIGSGIVPVKIDEILQSKNDEIRFILNGQSLAYDTYNYNIPVPNNQDGFPYIARATLCYFPKCERNQGVDYTDTELDIHFGRVKTSGIMAINNNKQSDPGFIKEYEKDARQKFRKWDNVKHVGEVLTEKPRMRKKYGDPLWGISLKTKERLQTGNGDKLKFGVVITLKNISGENRIQEFQQQCQLRGWLVTDINVQTQIDIYNQADTDVTWE